ncbi:MAG TPA: glucanase [Bacteroidetes bacterium]|nr:glucanase [Bacteroidota bacterium]HRK04864.1 M42 family metallopeptidase [Chlorobiota bacterium]
MNQPHDVSLEWLRTLLSIDSPTGYTEAACDFIVESLKALGLHPVRTTKGAIRCALGPNPTIALAAHTDTLGAIITSIQSNGTLRFSPLGGPVLAVYDGAYVRVRTLEGKVVEGTMLLDNPSVHANNKASTAERTTSSMHVRLDEVVQSADDVRKLGVRVGDIICVDPRTRTTSSGYIVSHFLDNKAGCVVLYDVARSLLQSGTQWPVELFFSTYEEVGHGGTTGYSPTLKDLLVIDMGVVGDGLGGSETVVSICAKDSGGPYDYGFRKRLIELAERSEIPHSIDVYPYYSSDGTAAWRAGVDVRVALIGPGVHASHGVERAHIDGIRATTDLAISYIKDALQSSPSHS